MTGSPAIVVATSIPPQSRPQDSGRRIDGDYQKVCIASWLECGFRILSVNAPDEVPDLAARFPQVTFIQVDRNAAWLSGRGNPFISDLLRTLSQVPERVVGIINSDIVFEPSLAWCEQLPQLTANTIVTAQRYDASSLAHGALRRFPWGFDYFFFEKPLADRLAERAMPFAMGLPWWDYWFPMAASLEGYETRVLERPAIVHLAHPTAYVESLWHRLGLTFAAYLARGLSERAGPPPQSLGSIAQLAYSLARSDALPGDYPRQMRSLHNIALQYVLALRGNVLRWDASATAFASGSSSSAPADVFRNFDLRVFAGEALDKAKKLETKGQTLEAATAYRSALDGAPKDFEALLGLGDNLLRRGNAQEAVDLFRQAETEHPDAPEIMNRLGASLRAAKDYQRAIEYYEKATRLAPQHQMTHYNLALTFEEADRPYDAIRWLEVATAKWPEFTLASDMLNRLRRAYPSA